MKIFNYIYNCEWELIQNIDCHYRQKRCVFVYVIVSLLLRKVLHIFHAPQRGRALNELDQHLGLTIAAIRPLLALLAIRVRQVTRLDRLQALGALQRQSERLLWRHWPTAAAAAVVVRLRS